MRISKTQHALDWVPCPWRRSYGVCVGAYMQYARVCLRVCVCVCVCNAQSHVVCLHFILDFYSGSAIHRQRSVCVHNAQAHMAKEFICIYIYIYRHTYILIFVSGWRFMRSKDCWSSKLQRWRRCVYMHTYIREDCGSSNWRDGEDMYTCIHTYLHIHSIHDDYSSSKLKWWKWCFSLS
jgi:hypothetical protein